MRHTKLLTKFFEDSQKNNSNGDRLKPMKRALAFCQNIELSKIFAAEFTIFESQTDQ